MKKTKLTAEQKRAWLSLAEFVHELVRTVSNPELPDESVIEPAYVLSLAKRAKKESKALYAALPFSSRAARKTFHRRWEKLPTAVMAVIALKLKKHDFKAPPPPVPPPTSLDN